MSDKLHNTSEIGKLKKVMLHRPGKELENLMPEYLDRLLFDDIPYLKVAQEEHDAFAETLRGCGAEVLYLTDLTAEAVADRDVREKFIAQFLDEAGVSDERMHGILAEYFGDCQPKELVLRMIAGVRKSELAELEKGRLSDFTEAKADPYPFIIDPMPNLYFTRDPFAVIGRGVSIHKMHTETRSRETLFGKYIFTYHPLYKDVPKWYDRGENTSIEGGDILVLNSEVIAVGISERTREESIDKFAHTVLSESSTFKKVLAISIPKTRAFMHLDTVFTMVDRDKFTVHPNIMQNMDVYVMTLGEKDKVEITEEQGRLEDILKEHLGLDKVTLIRCGSGNEVDSAREQWSDGSNTLAVAPGEVIVYSRNYVTNDALEENGIKIHRVPCSELSRGRGGPRCMSMPFVRDDV